MKLGFVSAILPDLSLAEVAKFGGSAGYQCVEVMCWPVGKADRRYAGVTHLDVADFSGDKAAEAEAVVAQHGLEISSLGYYPNLLTPDRDEADRTLAHAKRVIQAAAHTKARRFTSFVGRDWTKSVDANWPRFCEVWTPLVKFAEDHGVSIGIENCPMLFTNDEWPGGKNLASTPAIWRRMFSEIPSQNFGLNYDPSHLVWQQMDCIKPLREFKDRLVHVHAKDVRVDRHRLDDVGILAHPNEYHTPKLPGLGDVDWGSFFSALNEAGYRGPVCVEVEDRAYEHSLAARKAALIQSATYLRNFISPE